MEVAHPSLAVTRLEVGALSPIGGLTHRAGPPAADVFPPADAPAADASPADVPVDAVLPADVPLDAVLPVDAALPLDAAPPVDAGLPVVAEAHGVFSGPLVAQVVVFGPPHEHKEPAAGSAPGHPVVQAVFLRRRTCRQLLQVAVLPLPLLELHLVRKI